jgi:ABC-type protease/lipase transport system fused ATPase/permease subunit
VTVDNDNNMELSASNPLKAVLARSRTTFWSVGLFSCAVNILMLTGPLFMLQVYDRVLASRSVPTLFALFGLVAGLYIFLGLFDFIRTKALSRIGYRLDIELSSVVKKVWLFSSLYGDRIKARPVSDLTALRQFLCSNGLLALCDLPWVPIYLAVVYLLHVWLGLLATAGAIIVITATLINEWTTKKPISEASSWELQDAKFAEGTTRNADKRHLVIPNWLEADRSSSPHLQRRSVCWCSQECLRWGLTLPFIRKYHLVQ